MARMGRKFPSLMCQDDTHVDIDVQLKESPLKWIGKKWLEFLSN